MHDEDLPYDRMPVSQRRIEEARIRDALRDAPGDPLLNADLAELLALRGNLLGAEQIVDRGLLAVPDDPVLLAQAAELREVPDDVRSQSRGRSQPEVGPLVGAYCWCGSGKRRGACHARGVRR
jgi:hypothetical protein